TSPGTAASVSTPRTPVRAAPFLPLADPGGDRRWLPLQPGPFTDRATPRFPRSEAALPHISLPQDLPGIRSLVAYRTDTGQLLYELAERLLRSESTLSPADRELIAAYVSSRNECLFCTSSHAAASRHLYGERASVVDAVIADLETAPVDEKLRALLRIAGKVQQNGRLVTEDDIQAA